jgi:hypothetical protein
MMQHDLRGRKRCGSSRTVRPDRTARKAEKNPIVSRFARSGPASRARGKAAKIWHSRLRETSGNTPDNWGKGRAGSCSAVCAGFAHTGLLIRRAAGLTANTSGVQIHYVGMQVLSLFRWKRCGSSPTMRPNGTETKRRKNTAVSVSRAPGSARCDGRSSPKASKNRLSVFGEHG